MFKSPPADNGDSERHGLFVLTESPSWDLDIVVLHGLGGDAYSTWTADNKIMWPRDFIPKVLPTSRVMTFGYNSKFVLSPSTADIKDFALDLLNRLRNKRWSPEAMQHPIMFICHSLGGIVCKQSLLLAQSQPYYNNIFEKTTSIFFFGTPHRGSRVASWGTVIGNFINTSTFHKPIQKRLLQDLGPSSKVLADISAAFKVIADGFDIKTFYETVIMLPLKYPVVERDSAILGLPTEQTIPIAANHREMVRFTNINSEKFDPVKYALREVKEGNPLSMTDTKLAIFYITNELTVVDYARQLSQISERYESTCEWLLSNVTFSSWFTKPESDTIWLRGYAGVGKSVMTKFLITDILSTPYVDLKQKPSVDEDRAVNHQSFLVYFFCSERDRHLQSEESILRSILHQLLCAAPFEVIRSMQRFRVAFGRYSFLQKTSDLWRVLETILIAINWTTTYIVLDGLDEVLANDLNNIIKGLKTLTETTVPRIQPRRIKLLLVSRPITSIDLEISCPSVSLRSERDVRYFIQGKTNELARRYELSEQLQREIVERISEKAKDMFLWAILAWYELCRDARRVTDFAANLLKTQQLPASLESLYEDILGRLDPYSRDLSLRIFAWLTLATRPMHSTELRFMVAFDATEESPKTARSKMMSLEQLQSLCPELIHIGRDGYLQFVHSSVRDFFLSPATNVKYRIDATSMHSKIAVQCLKALYLRSGPEIWADHADLCEGGRHITHFTEQYFHIAYAATDWHHHAIMAGEDRQVWATFAKFLTCTEAVRLWLMLTLYDGSEDAREGWALRYDFWARQYVPPPPIHIAVFVGNQYFVRKVVQEGANVSALNKGWRNTDKKYCVPKLPVGGTALHFEGLNAELLNLLLDLGADMNVPNDFGLSALTLAVSERDEAKVVMLLAYARRLRTSRSGIGYDAGVLNFAASMTMKTAVKEILDDPLIDLSDSMFQSKDNSVLGTYQTSTLEHACLHGLQTMADLMMVHPRMIAAQQRLEQRFPQRNPTSIAFLTALQGWGDLTLVALRNFQTSLSTERDMNKRTILIHAVMEEWHDVLEYCLEQLPRSKLNMQDKNAMTALHHAAKARNWYAAQRLLEAGADYRAEDQNGMTPAHIAAETGSDRVLRIMLNKGAVELDSLDHKKRTVLHYVATWNLYAVTETIVDFAPNQVAATDYQGRTALHLAALFGSTAVLSHLLSTRLVNINAQDHFGRSLLHLAVEGRVESCINELLSREETDLNIMDRMLKSPLDMTYTIKDPEQAAEIRAILEEAGCRPGYWRPRREYAQYNMPSDSTEGVNEEFDRSDWQIVQFHEVDAPSNP